MSLATRVKTPPDSWWPNHEFGEGDLSLAALERFLTMSLHPVTPYLGGLERCSKDHAWTGRPPLEHFWAWHNGTVVEGFCPLCTGVHLKPTQPWLGVIGHRDTDEWREGCLEWWGECPCCSLLYHCENDGVATTGGGGCETLWPSEIERWEVTLINGMEREGK